MAQLSHNRLSPGVEFYEYDRSQYGQKQDYSLVDTTTLVCGFADKGQDTIPVWINTKTNLEEEFGAPTNEVERYFYNGVNETLNRGGVALAVRLPYANEYKDKFSYVDYDVLLGYDAQTPYDFKKEYGVSVYNQITAADSTITSFYKISPVNRNVSISAQIDYPRDFKTALKTIAKTLKLDYTVPEDSTDIYNELMDFMLSVDAAEIIGEHKEDYDDNYRSCKQTIYDFISWINENWTYCNGTGYITIEDYDRLCTNSRFMTRNKVRFVDITRQRYGKACIKQRLVKNENTFVVKETQCLGYMPVITTALNAMYFGDMISCAVSTTESGMQCECASAYSVVNDFESIRCRWSYNFTDMYSVPFSSDYKYDDTVSKRAADLFPVPAYASDGRLQRDNLKKIGVVVFQVTSDEADDSKLQFTPVEAFTGSFERNAKDPDTNGSVFIDDIVNANSKYINMFSNVNTQSKAYQQAQIAVVEKQNACVLGFYYDEENEKTIDYTESILKPLTKIFDKLQDSNQMRLDIAVDAGVSNISQFVSIYSKEACDAVSADECNGDMYPYGPDGSIWNFDGQNLNVWRVIVQKYDNFCKNMRKDCMFIADGPRTLVLEGNQKRIRDQKSERTIANTIIPNIRYISGINSSYSAGYCNWFKQKDAYSGDMFWIPPSIKAAGVYVYTDTYYKPWDAPAGLTRGVLADVYDVSFDPRNDEAGKIYQHAWNYATNFPLEGIVVEGQRTFQLQQTALDRINVRRLMLYLEKNIVRMGRRFLYEGNTESLRQKYADLVGVLLADAQQRDGIREYAVKCDSDINTDETIDRHELHMIVGIKPVKTIEWIRLNFIVTNQSASVSEEVLRGF